MSWFDFTLKHVPNTKIGKTDGLSRRLDWKVGIEKDNKNQTLIKEQLIHSLVEVVIEGPKIYIVEKNEKDKEQEQRSSQNSKINEEGRSKGATGK